MRSLFGSSNNPATTRGPDAARVNRHSSGWNELLKHLRVNDSLRILDIGPTSSSNINYITSLGHSIYMANVVEEASKPEWLLPAEEGEPAGFDVEGFLKANLNFAGRMFDVVILWDTADYLPESLLGPIFTRIHQVLQPGGLMLAFFHTTRTPETTFCRYHLTDSDVVGMQRAGNYPLVQIYSNRKIENMLSEFSGYRFFLAKDSLREVIITR
jgi:cyclopropane fatty-acyl-phospholipid synthase-like methyltransferase